MSSDGPSTAVRVVSHVLARVWFVRQMESERCLRQPDRPNEREDRMPTIDHAYQRTRCGTAQQCSELTERELDVARLVGDGLTDKQIAARLFISPHTVNYHLRNLYRKLGIDNRVSLVRRLLTTTVADESPVACDGHDVAVLRSHLLHTIDILLLWSAELLAREAGVPPTSLFAVTPSTMSRRVSDHWAHPDQLINESGRNQSSPSAFSGRVIAREPIGDRQVS
jgi:DNA-binding CsgD family transcriptional regulator